MRDYATVACKRCGTDRMNVTVIDEPAAGLILSLASPGFATSYPTLRHRARIPADRLGAMAAWEQRQVPAREIRVFRLRRVFVTMEGLVFDAAFNLFGASRTQHEDEAIRQGLAAVKLASASGQFISHAAPAVLVKKRGVTNYGHFMVEMLPRAFLADRHLASDQLTYVVHTVSGPLADIMARAFAMLGIPPRRIVATGPEPAYFEELFLVDGLSDHGRFMSPRVLDCIDHLAGQVQADPPAPLYVSRRQGGIRCPADEPALIEMLQARGMRVLDPGRMTLDAQIAAFKQASGVLGVMGAGLTNIAFAPPGRPVVVLAPAIMTDTFFWFLANLRQQRYYEMRCVQHGPVLGTMDWDTALLCPAEEVTSLLDEAQVPAIGQSGAQASVDQTMPVAAARPEGRPRSAVPDLPGENYLTFIARLHALLRPRSYLEIGTLTGDALALAGCASIAVNPVLRITADVFGSKPACHIFQTTSDRFFRDHDPQAILGAPVELAFLDGTHLFEFLLRDFANVERSSQRNSVIMLHDCVPTDVHVAERLDDPDRRRRLGSRPDWWTGDVWKIVPILRRFRPDLVIHAVDAAPTGLVLVTNLDPRSDTLRVGYFDIVREFASLDLQEYGLDAHIRGLDLVSTGTLRTLADIGTRFWL